MPTTAQPPRDPGATPLEIAVSSAEELEREWTERVTNGIDLFLADFDWVPLTPPASQALAAARRHLQDAQAQIHSLTAEFLAANHNHGTEA